LEIYRRNYNNAANSVKRIYKVLNGPLPGFCLLFPSVFQSQAEGTSGTSQATLVTFQGGERIVDFFQVCFLAFARKMQKKGVLQLWTVKADLEGFAGLLLK